MEGLEEGDRMYQQVREREGERGNELDLGW